MINDTNHVGIKAEKKSNMLASLKLTELMTAENEDCVRRRPTKAGSRQAEQDQNASAN